MTLTHQKSIFVCVLLWWSMLFFQNCAAPTASSKLQSQKTNSLSTSSANSRENYASYGNYEGNEVNSNMNDYRSVNQIDRNRDYGSSYDSASEGTRDGDQPVSSDPFASPGNVDPNLDPGYYTRCYPVTHNYFTGLGQMGGFRPRDSRHLGVYNHHFGSDFKNTGDRVTLSCSKFLARNNNDVVVIDQLNEQCLKAEGTVTVECVGYDYHVVARNCSCIERELTEEEKKQQSLFNDDDDN